tara:strand:- start:2971 stop:3231 length:261 start_codon:yes stop_codon:yes gene_type:complete
LLAARIRCLQLAGQGGACQLINFYRIGFMTYFGYRKRVMMKLHRHKIVGATADRLEHAGQSGKSACPMELNCWHVEQKSKRKFALN